MDKDKLIKRLMATFLEELDEHVRALNQDLLALEKASGREDRADHLKALFRTAHSLKGASRSVNVGVIESACHQLEELLSPVRDGSRTLSPDQFALLFETADAIEEAAMRLREQQDLSGAPLALLLPRLEAAAHGAAGPRPRNEERGSKIEDRGSRTEDRGSKGKERAPGGEKPVTTVEAAPTAAAGEVPSPSVVNPASSILHLQSSVLRPQPSTPADGGPATVRVPAEKLDALLAQSGELLVARRRVQSRARDVTALREFVGHWKAEWRAVEKALGKVLQEAVAENGVHPPPEAAERLKQVPRRVALALGRAAGNLRQLDKDLERLSGSMAEDGALLKQVADALDDEVRRVRMLPFAEACQGLERMLRDLAQSTQKEVDLVIEGGDVELDRSVLEGLKDPLRHLVRNAVDHGVEPARERAAAGKPARGRVRVAAVLRGAHVEVSVSDDGRGLNLDALRQQARRRKLPEPADERELARLVFLPGLSTAQIITDVSGRGVGLDVVKSRVEALHGTVELSFARGAGTSFTLAVPLTLTTLRALLVAAGGQTFALAGTNVQKLVRVDPADFRSIEGREMLPLGGTPVPVVSLAEVLDLRAGDPPAGKASAVVVAAGDKRMAFVVDEFVAEQEIMIKGLGARIRRARHVSGATILPSGKVALLLNAASLIRTALARTPARALAAALTKAAPEARKRVLVAEDSLTTRTLMKSILEAAGYEVAVAADGAAAWQLLQERPADLVVSDVDMPRMDGFSLTEAVRNSKRFHDLPVILVTARESDQDKARGIEVKADAYLVKSAFDQKNLLEAIGQLV